MMRTKENSGTILIVDDELVNLELLSNILTKEGYKVRVSDTGREALALINSEKPDLVLLDIILPDMDGYEVCTILKTEEKTRLIPVIFISALYETSDKTRGFSVGGVDFITKPFVAEEVLARAKIHIEISRMWLKQEDQAIELQLKNEQLQIEMIDRKLASDKLSVSLEKLEKNRMASLNLMEDLKDEIEQHKKTEKKLGLQYSLLTALINSPQDIIIFSLDKNYCYTAFNEKHRAEMKLVWNADINIGTNLLECMSIPEIKELAKKSIDRTFNGEVFSEIQHQTDLNIYYELNWNPIFQNEIVIGATVFIRNITERKRAEDELNRQLNELQRWQAVTVDREDRIRELKNEVNDLLKEAGRPGKYGE